MAQVDLWGATYSDVPAVDLPSGNSTVRFTDVTDTTATASDVASGKYFYGVDGARTLGTATIGGGSVTQDQEGYIVLPQTGGGGITVDSLSVTQNGTYTAQTGHAYSPVTVNVSGGASNVVYGTFTTGSASSIKTVTVPYTGSGYPMAIMFYIPEGLYNSSGSIYNTLHNKGVVAGVLIKGNTDTPSYTGITSHNEDKAYRSIMYKNSTSSASSFTAGGGSASMYDGLNSPSSSSLNTVVKITSKNQFKVYVSSAENNGFIPNTEYCYCIAYSS